MSEITLHYRDLNRKIEELRNLNSQFFNSLQELESTEAQINGMWEGAAKKAFHSAFMNDKLQMDTFHLTVELYAQSLVEILSGFISAENRNVEIANNRNYK